MLDILFLAPSDVDVFGKMDVEKFDADAFPLGIAYIAANARKNGYSVDVAELRLWGKAWKENLRNKIEKERPRYVGITCVTPLIKECRSIASFVRETDKNIKIIIGGPHPTVMPEEVAKLDEFDIVVIGEAELTVPEILRGDDLEKVKGIIYKKDGGLVRTPPREINMDLDKLPWPTYDLIPVDRYVNPFLGKSVIIATGRGCPFRCIFCPSNLIGGGKYRLRNITDVADEMEFLYKKYNVRGFMIMDETFTLYPERVTEMCREIKKRNMKIKWACDTRVSTVNEELLKTMKDAGFRLVKFGIESGDNEILRLCKKGITTDMVRKAVKLAKEAGLEVHGFFIIGHAYDTKETILKTIEFSKELPLDYVQFSIMVPFPGTEIYRMAKEGEGIRLLSDDWNEFKKYGRPIIELPTVSREELEKFHAMAYKQFYFRPSYIARKLLKTRPQEYPSMLRKALALKGFIKKSGY